MQAKGAQGSVDRNCFDDFERFAKLWEDWLRRFPKLPHGPPSDDAFRGNFTVLDPKGFFECFIALANSIRPIRLAFLKSVGSVDPLVASESLLQTVRPEIVPLTLEMLISLS